MRELSGPTAPEGFAPRLLRDELGTSLLRDAGPRTVFPGIVLFVDLVDSTSMTDRVAALGPDGAERLGGALNAYFSDVIDAVDGEGGDIVCIEGDGVIALWRSDPSLPSPHFQAARAALALREKAQLWPLEPALPMHRRLTLVAGMFTTILLTSDSKRSFLVLAGEPWKTIGAISHKGQPGDIILDPRMAQLIAPSAVIEPIPDPDDPANGVVRLLRLEGEARVPRTLSPDHPVPSVAAPDSFVPRIVMLRSKLESWMTEFRIVSLVFVRLGEPDTPDLAGARQLQMTFEAVANAAQALDVEIFSVIAGEKGVVAVVVCGLPPFGLESNASRAAGIAKRVRDKLLALNIPCAIGVATGRVFCGVVGNAIRREYLLDGPVLNYGARLMQAANGEVLCDAETAGATAALFVFSAAEELIVRGRAQPLTVHRLIDSQPQPSFPATRRGRLFGRDAELAELRDRLERVGRGDGGLVVLEGEPGAGKSRLLQETGRDARASGFCMIETSTHVIERATAYYSFRSVVRQLLQDPGEGSASSTSSMRKRLGDALREADLAQKAALIEDIVPLGVEISELAAQIKGAARKTGIEDIVVTLAAMRASERPVVILIDDLHWIDALSAELLITLSRRLPQMLIVATSRPRDAATAPYAAQVMDRAVRQIEVRRIDARATAQMLSDLLGAPSIPRRLTEFVHGQSEGLPIHVEQLALALRERELIETVDGRCRVVTPDLAAAAVPSRLSDVVVDRIDKLSQTDQLVAKVASVIGRTFEFEVLLATYPFPIEAETLDESISRLERAGILAPISGEGGRTHAFRHLIIQEATYDLLSYAQRRPLHRRLVDLIERRHANAPEPYYAELAHHCEHAGETERAIAFRMLAARLSLRRHANDDALMHVERAERLAAQAHLALANAQRAEMALVRGEALHELARFPEAGRQFNDCLRLNGVRRPASSMAMGLSVMAQVAQQASHRLGFVRRPHDAEVRARKKLSAHLNTRLAEHAYFMSNSLELAYDVLAALNQAERIGSVGETIESYGALAIGLGIARLHFLARYYRRRSIETAKNAGELRDQAFAQLFAGVYSQPAGDWSAARLHLAEGATIFGRLGDRFRLQSCLCVSAYVAIGTGDFALARSTFDSFGPDAEAVDNPSVRAWTLAGLSTLDLIEGRSPQPALRRLEIARDPNLHRAEQLQCEGLVAAASLQAGDLEGAERSADVALRNMQQAACTMGIAWISVGAVAETYLALLERALARGERREDLGMRTQEACRAVRAYASGTRICQPRAHWLEARRALLEGRTSRAASFCRRGLEWAERLAMPLDEAFCHLGLVATLAEGQARATQQERGLRLMRNLGARPWGHEAGAWVPAIFNGGG